MFQALLLLVEDEAKTAQNTFDSYPLNFVGSLVAREGYKGSYQGLRRFEQIVNENIAELQELTKDDE